MASTGGLVDTVKEGVTGFHIGELDADALIPADVAALVATAARAAETYGTPAYAAMSKNCISQVRGNSKTSGKLHDFGETP